MSDVKKLIIKENKLLKKRNFEFCVAVHKLDNLRAISTNLICHT